MRIAALLLIFLLTGCGGAVTRLSLLTDDLIPAEGNHLYASDFYNDGRGLDIPNDITNDKIFGFGNGPTAVRPNGEFSPSILPRAVLPPAQTSPAMNDNDEIICQQAKAASTVSNFSLWQPAETLTRPERTNILFEFATDNEARTRILVEASENGLDLNTGFYPTPNTLMQLEISDGALWEYIPGNPFNEGLETDPPRERKLDVNMPAPSSERRPQLLAISLEQESARCSLSIESIRTPSSECLPISTKNLQVKIQTIKHPRLNQATNTSYFCISTALVNSLLP